MPRTIKTPLAISSLTLLCSVALSPSAWALGPSAWEKEALNYQADIAK